MKRSVCVVWFLWIVFGTTAIAQEFTRASVYGGYSYVNIDTNDLASRQSANGWEAAVTGNFNKWFGAEFDVAGHYKTYLVTFENVNVDVKVTDYSYLAGPRINIRPLFIHALIGGDHLTGSVGALSESQDSLAGAFGGGVEWPVSARWSVRSSVDYIFTRHNIFGGPSFTQNNVHVGVGLVYSFGIGRTSAPRLVVERRSHTGLPIPTLGLVAMSKETGGAEITEVVPGSIASQAGLRVGDVINSIDSKSIKSPMELQAELSNRAPGTKVRLGYMARGYWQSETMIILK